MRYGQSSGHVTRAILAGILTGSMSLCTMGCSSTDSDISENPTVSTSESNTEPSATDETPSLKTEEEIPTDGSPLLLIDATDMWSSRDLDASYDEATAIPVKLGGSTATMNAVPDGVSVTDKAVTISSEGTYILSGEAENLGIIIDAPDDAKVQIVLDGASINRTGYAGIYAKSADKVFLTVKDGTDNSVRSTGEFSQQDDNTVDGAVFAKCDLTVNGTGTISVASESGHGIVCKDDLRLVSSNMSIQAARHAVQAKDSVAVHDGTWALVGGKDAIHSENSDDMTKGWCYIDGGSLSIESGTDGIDSESWLQIDGGTFSVQAGDDGLHSELDLAVNGGTIDISQCNEGLEGGTVTITAGDVSILASDDGINATGNQTGGSSNSTNQLALPDMPQNQDTGNEVGMTNQPPAEQGDNPPSAEGAPSQNNPTDGTGGMADGTQPEPPQGFHGGTNPPAKPDGSDNGRENAPAGQENEMPDRQAPPESPSDGTEGSANADEQGVPRQPMGAPAGGGGAMMDVDATAILTISGGRMSVDASGDGFDSNGLIHITGGETYVTGPISDGNTAIDYGSELRIDGGTIVATGSSGMVEAVSGSSKQASMTVFLDSPVTGPVTVTGNGFDAIGHSPTREYSAILVSSPVISPEGAYNLATGDLSQIVQMHGTVTTVGTFQTRSGQPSQRDMRQDGFARPEDLIGQRLIDNDDGTGTHVNGEETDMANDDKDAQEG